MSLLSLPAEILADIATRTSGKTTLSFLHACRHLRNACFQYLVLRSILIRSNEDAETGPLDISTLDSTAKLDARIWLQFVIAATRVEDMCGSPIAHHYYLGSPLHPFLAPLLLVHHPIFTDSCWTDWWSDHAVQLLEAKQIDPFCTTALILSNPSFSNYLITCLLRHLKGNASVPSDYEAIWIIRASARHTDPLQPFPVLPSHISFAPLSPSYSLPIPFPIRSLSHLNFSSWLSAHTAALSYSSSLLSGRWTGYLATHNGTSYTPSTRSTLAPLPSFSFTSGKLGSHSFTEPNTSHFYSYMHRSGAGMFASYFCATAFSPIPSAVNPHPPQTKCGLSLMISAPDARGEVHVGGQYMGLGSRPGSLSMLWDCKMTPFGIAGRYGVYPPGRRGGERVEWVGWVWLFREEWIATARLGA